MRAAVVVSIIFAVVACTAVTDGETLYYTTQLEGTPEVGGLDPKYVTLSVIGPDNIYPDTPFDLTLEIIPDDYADEEIHILDDLNVFLVGDDAEISLMGLRIQESYFDGQFHVVPIASENWQLFSHWAGTTFNYLLGLADALHIVSTGKYLYSCYAGPDLETEEGRLEVISSMNEFDYYPMHFDNPGRTVFAVKYTVPIVINELNTPIKFDIQNLKLPGWAFPDGCCLTFNPAGEEHTLPCPELNSPADGSANPTRPFDIAWEPVQDAESYTLWYAFGGSQMYVDMGDSTSLTINEDFWTNLPDYAYRWWVTASNETCQSDKSETWRFTKQGGSGPSVHYYVDANIGDDSNDGSQESPWLTITHALDSVTGTGAEPVTILVAAGTYSTSTNGETFPLNMKSWISLSGDGQQTTVLDGEQSAYHVIYASYVDQISISGLTITGGDADGSHYVDEHDRGGGIYCDHSHPIISNNTISGNYAYDDGGGIYCYKSSPTIENNTISGNSTKYGSCGISCIESSPTISNNTITDNTTAREGGAGGGGIYCYKSSSMISNNTITGNAAYYSGGGIDCYESSPTIWNNTITDNATGWGGGIYCSKSSPTISNNTITGNTASGRHSIRGYGGGICCEYSSAPTIIDCIIWGNGDDLYNCSPTYCCIEDLDEGEGNIHDDPICTTGPLGEYYLNPDSPCIDAGSQSAEDAGLSDRTTQTDGTPDTGTVDMGYHYPIE